MLKFASSVVANISDTLGPLVRSPLDSATLNWTKIEYVVQAIPTDEFNPTSIIQSINQLVEALRRDENDRRGLSFEISDHSNNQSVVSFLSEANAIAVLASAALNNKKAALTGICIKAIDALLSVTTSPLLQSPGSLSSLLSLTTDLIESDASSRLHRTSLISLARAIALKAKEDELTATEFSKLLHLDQSNARTLIDYLIQHINHWSVNGQNACCALLDLSCASGQGANISVVLANSTQLSNLLVAGLCELTAQLPPISECPPFKSLWTDNPAASSFIQRLEFIDRVCHLAPTIITNEIGHEFHAQFLDLVLAPMILDVREDNSCWATIFMYHCCVRVSHPILIRAIARFVLGTEAAPKSHILVRRTLVQRIDSLSERLCQSTLQLFTAICQFRDPSIVDALVTASPDAPNDINLNSLECLQPLQAVAGEMRHHVEYSDYLLDAQTEQLKWQAVDSNPRALPHFRWADSDERTLFITTLMNKLDSVFENSLATNLRLAALVTSIASCPSLNSQIAVYHQNTERSLISALTALTVAAKRRASRLSQFDKRLAAAQRRIQEALDAEQDRSSVQRKGSASSPSSLQSDGLYIVSAGNGKGESLIGVEPLDIERFLAGRCILEAICIQIVAIKDNQRRTLKVPAVELPIAEPVTRDV